MNRMPGCLRYLVVIVLLVSLAAAGRLLLNHLENQKLAVHIPEVEQAIHHYELSFKSVEATHNADLRAELATGEWLERENHYLSRLTGDDTRVVVTDAQIHEVRVLEYDASRFKASACVSKQFQVVTIDGTLLEEFPPGDYCAVYVFWKEDGKWKLAGAASLDRENRRYWWNAPQWLRDVIGELP